MGGALATMIRADENADDHIKAKAKPIRIDFMPMSGFPEIEKGRPKATQNQSFCL